MMPQIPPAERDDEDPEDFSEPDYRERKGWADGWDDCREAFYSAPTDPPALYVLISYQDQSYSSPAGVQRRGIFNTFEEAKAALDARTSDYFHDRKTEKLDPKPVNYLYLGEVVEHRTADGCGTQIVKLEASK